MNPTVSGAVCCAGPPEMSTLKLLLRGTCSISPEDDRRVSRSTQGLSSIDVTIASSQWSVVSVSLLHSL